MNEDILRILQEEIGDDFVDVRGIFEGYVPPAAQREAVDMWEEKAKTRDGQLELLDAAMHSEPTAVNYLYSAYLPLTMQAFWKYYIGPNKKLGSKKIVNGGAADFASRSYEMLSGMTNPSPFRTFNPDKINSGSLINAFSYYYYRYIQSEAFKLNRNDKIIKDRKGLMGGEDEENLSFDSSSDSGAVVQSLDSFEKAQDIPVEDFSNKADIGLIFDDFSKWLEEHKAPEYKDIWDKLRAGVSYADIAADYGWPAQKIRNYFKRIRRYFLQKYPNLESMMK